jgi:hypothetical protein
LIDRGTIWRCDWLKKKPIAWTFIMGTLLYTEKASFPANHSDHQTTESHQTTVRATVVNSSHRRCVPITLAARFTKEDLCGLSSFVGRCVSLTRSLIGRKPIRAFLIVYNFISLEKRFYANLMQVQGAISLRGGASRGSLFSFQGPS